MWWLAAFKAGTKISGSILYYNMVQNSSHACLVRVSLPSPVALEKSLLLDCREKVLPGWDPVSTFF